MVWANKYDLKFVVSKTQATLDFISTFLFGVYGGESQYIVNTRCFVQTFMPLFQAKSKDTPS